MQFTIQGLIGNPRRLEIRASEERILVHPRRDPGVFLQCHEFLRSRQREARYALVMFDKEGCGSIKPRVALETEVEARLRQNGWEQRSAAIAIEPELEAWVWGEYAAVAASLGWSERLPLRERLEQQGFLDVGNQKPERPKEALEFTLKTLKRPRSSSIYLQLAGQVPFDNCIDPAFRKLTSTLQAWFRAR